MSQRHHDTFASIRREYEDVVAALTLSRRDRKRGAPGLPTYVPSRLEAAIATAGDAYALLLIATAERFLREYLLGIGVHVGNEPRLSWLIDQSVKQLNHRSTSVQLRAKDKVPVHDLRAARNHSAHGHGFGAFPSVPVVQETLSRFLAPFP